MMGRSSIVVESRSETRRGTVDWFNAERGFGFIIEDSTGARYFVHARAIQGDDPYRKLIDGQRVSFQLEPHIKGPRAVRVRAL